MYAAFDRANFADPMLAARTFLNVYVRLQFCPELEAKLELLQPREAPKRRHSMFHSRTFQTPTFRQPEAKRRRTIVSPPTDFELDPFGGVDFAAQNFSEYRGIFV